MAVIKEAEAPRADFDAWMENPYTKVLQKSIEEDFVPRADVDTAGASDLLPNALWTRRGSGTDEWWSFRGYEARKDTAAQWVLRKSGEEIYRHTDLQVVMAHAERAILAARDGKNG